MLDINVLKNTMIITNYFIFLKLYLPHNLFIVQIVIVISTSNEMAIDFIFSYSVCVISYQYLFSFFYSGSNMIEPQCYRNKLTCSARISMRFVVSVQTYFVKLRAQIYFVFCLKGENF